MGVGAQEIGQSSSEPLVQTPIRERGAGKQHPPNRPDRARLLRIVRRAKLCAPLTSAEITEAARRKDQSGQLLAAAALHNMRRTERPPRARPWNHDLLTYVAQGTTKEHYRAHRGFGALLAAVNITMVDFENTYIPNGKPDRRALGDLYDHTDILTHPILGALPPANAYSDEDPRRNAIVQADRLLRYILLQAQVSQVTPSAESV